MFCGDDKIVFNTFSPLSKFVASVVLFGYLSASCWTLCIVIFLYLNVISGWKKKDIDKALKPMWAFSLGLPLIAVAIGNYRGFGYSKSFQTGFPFFAQQDESWWMLALLPIPIISMFSLGFLIMIYVIYRVSAILLGKEDLQLSEEEKTTNKTIKNQWRKMLNYNQRSILFVLLIGLGGIAGMASIVEVATAKRDETQKALEDFLTCILSVVKPYSLPREDMDSYPTEVCGSVYDSFDSWGKLYLAAISTELFGIFPLIVYGLKGKIKQRVGNFVGSVRESIGTKSPHSSHTGSGRRFHKKSSQNQDDDDENSKVSNTDNERSDGDNTLSDSRRHSSVDNSFSEDDMAMIPLVGMLVDAYRVVLGWTGNGQKGNLKVQEELNNDEENEEDGVEMKEMEENNNPGTSIVSAYTQDVSL